MTPASNIPPAKVTRLIHGNDIPPDVGLKQPRRVVAIGAVLASMAAVVVDAGISNVALPTIAVSLKVTPSSAMLVVTAYQTAVVMALLPAAALAARFGYRRIFTWGVALFTAASAVCAFAPSLQILLISRFTQGLGSAAILALGVALLRFSVSDRRLGAAISWNALTVALSGAAGPALGALILSQTHWNFIYVVNLPVGIAVLFAARALPAVAGPSTPLDMISLTLYGSAFALAVAAVECVATPIGAAISLGGAAISVLLLILRERSKLTPFIPFDLLRSTSFRNSLAASVFCFAGQTAGLIALPFFLQHGLNQPAPLAALYLSAWPLGVAATALFAGRLANHVSTALLCAVGGVIISAGLSGAAFCPSSSDFQMIVIFIVLGGAGFGLFQISNNRNMFLAAARERSGAAGAMQGTARITGQTVGALLAASLFAVAPMKLAPEFAMYTGAALTLAAGAMSLSRLRH